MKNPSLKKLIWKKLSQGFSFFCLFIIKVYQTFFAVHFSGACRFYPSCSHYAEKVFLAKPPKKAFLLTLKRLGKCHTFGPFGLDEPSPPTQQKKTF